MKILLTGGNGMVGKNLLEHPLAAEHSVIAPSRAELNLLDLNSVERYFSHFKPEFVIHAAGTVGGIQANMEDPVRFLYENMQMGMNLIKSAAKSGVPNLLNLGSSCMYPKEAVNPLVEESILTGSLEPTNEGYALAKIACAKLCEYYSYKNSNLNYKTVIPCNLYGRHDNFEKNRSHMIPSVIDKIHQAKLKEKPVVEIWGDGTARREFMYAGDLADFILHSIDKFDELSPYLNVGLGRDYSINEYYEAIADVIGFNGKFKHDVTKPTGMKQKLVDVTRLEDTGWKAKTELLEGLKKTYSFYLGSC